ncbi:MAG: aminoglycoside 6-adenylyltransferase [Bacillota bacterium]
MVEWKIGLDNDWGINTGKFGSKFKDYLDTNIWKELKNTFSDGNIERNWDSLFKMITFYSNTSIEIANKLNFDYPKSREKKVTELIEKIYRREEPF